MKMKKIPKEKIIAYCCLIFGMASIIAVTIIVIGRMSKPTIVINPCYLKESIEECFGSKIDKDAYPYWCTPLKDGRVILKKIKK